MQSDRPESGDALEKKMQRWDDIRRSQFGVALTTFTALATGGVGYCARLLADDRIDHFTCRASFWLVLSGCAFGLGLLAGVFCTWTRLWDARLTASLHHATNQGASQYERGQIETKFEFWGSVTWILFHTLVIAVSLGIVSLLGCIVGLYGHKLF
jgi:hypothetical protein